MNQPLTQLQLLNDAAYKHGFNKDFKYINIVLAADRLLDFVNQGGWLGENMEQHAFALRNEDGEVLVGGEHCFNKDTKEQAYKLALLVDPKLFFKSLNNFHTKLVADATQSIC